MRAVLGKEALNIKQLMQDELDCFNQILVDTNLFIDNLDSTTLESILHLLDEREKQINLINDIEHIFSHGKSDLITKPIRDEISAIVKNIIAIDAQVMETIQIMKTEILNDMSQLMDRKVQVRKKQKSLIDITQ